MDETCNVFYLYDVHDCVDAYAASRDASLKRLNELYEEIMAEYRESDNPDIKDKMMHIERVTAMAQAFDNDKVLHICAALHDAFGRMMQYKILSKLGGTGVFDDSIVDHHVLGEQAMREFVRTKKIESNDEFLELARAVALYHGLSTTWPTYLRGDARFYVETVSILDDIDNGTVGFLSYMEREIRTDAKKTMLEKVGGATEEIRRSGIVSDSVMRHLRKGEKFNKFEECKTYADYLVFAMILGIQFLKDSATDLRKFAKRNLEQAVTGYEGLLYTNGIEGIEDLVNKFVCEGQRDEVMKIFMDFYNAPEPTEYVASGLSFLEIVKHGSWKDFATYLEKREADEIFVASNVSWGNLDIENVELPEGWYLIVHQSDEGDILQFVKEE